MSLSASSKHEPSWLDSVGAVEFLSPTPFAPHRGPGHGWVRSIHTTRFVSGTGRFGNMKLGILIALTSLHCLWKEVFHGGYHDS